MEAESVKLIVRDLRLRPKLGNRDHALLSQYVWDMTQAVSEATRVLRVGGRAIYVIGDSTIRGTFIRNSAIIEKVAEDQGLSLTARRSRELPANRRYLPPPNRGIAEGAMDFRMSREVILTFVKVADGTDV
jgi:hypothetical protein